MKNSLLSLIALSINLSLFGQLGVGTTVPDASSILDAKSTSKGFLPPRVTKAQQDAIPNPATGLVVYCTNCTETGEGCLTTNNGTPSSPLWECVGSPAPSIAASCNGFVSGTYSVGSSVAGSYTVTITNSTFSIATIAFQSSDLVLSGVSGSPALTVGTPTGSPALSSGTTNLLPGTSVTVTYPITGTPTTIGTLTGVWTKGLLNCSATTAVSVGIGAGSFSGKLCFDVALSNDNANSCGSLVSRITNQSNFTQTATNTQIYTFTPIGTVSNVRFTFLNTNGTPVSSISGNNTSGSISTPVLATVVYNSNSNTLATGLTNTNALTADLIVTYNDGLNNSGVDRQLKITPNIKDCACCMAKVSATLTKEFLCHNVGADVSLDPHVPVENIHGNLYQWGRISPVANTTTPVTITGWNTTSAADNSLLDASKTVNDPCPAGYRIPTSAEWNGVITNNTLSRTGTWVNSSTNFGSALHFGPSSTNRTLTLPAAGYRGYTNGVLTARGNQGNYLSSTQVASPNANYFFFSNTLVYTSGIYRATGLSARCIAQ